MKIEEQDIIHIAELSRLQLTPEEIDKFGEQLGTILDYVGQLKEVDTKKVEATAQVSGLVDVLRTDDVKEWDKAEVQNALQQGELAGGQVKVKRVL
jgi:aspartyl-tRNA(Asn)/glutamyl-tRNA(Gln) amidotransferase subunit C